MKCSEIESQLDNYLNATRYGDDLDEPRAADIALHIQGCAQCRVELEHRQVLRDDLRSLPVPTPSAGFFDHAVAQAAAKTADAGRHHRRRTDSPVHRKLTGTWMSLAASLFLALLVGTLYFTDADTLAPDTGLPTITLATDTVTPVKLAFSTERALKGARLSLSLPVGVELMGYEGRSDLSWSTDLEQGTNVLRLPLVGRTAASDFLIARLEHPTGVKTFRLHVTVNQSGASDDE